VPSRSSFCESISLAMLRHEDRVRECIFQHQDAYQRWGAIYDGACEMIQAYLHKAQRRKTSPTWRRGYPHVLRFLPQELHGAMRILQQVLAALQTDVEDVVEEAHADDEIKCALVVDLLETFRHHGPASPTYPQIARCGALWSILYAFQLENAAGAPDFFTGAQRIKNFLRYRHLLSDRGL